MSIGNQNHQPWDFYLIDENKPETSLFNNRLGNSPLIWHLLLQVIKYFPKTYH